MPKEYHNQLINRIHDAALGDAVAQYATGRLIDIGCGTKPYATLLKGHVSEHIGVDYGGSVHGNPETDIIATAYDIPLPSESFNTALCTAVLEHLEEPEIALKEALRLLRPGGYAIYTVPFIWHLHEEPRDFYRFSRYGLEYLFEKVGFDVVDINALSGFWVTFGQLFLYRVWALNRGVVAKLRLLHPIVWIVNAIAPRLDRLDPSRRWTWMYLVVARRPEQDP